LTANDHPREKNLLFEGNASKDGMIWRDLIEQASRLVLLTDSVNVVLGEHTFNIGFHFQQREVDMGFGNIGVKSITSSVSPLSAEPEHITMEPLKREGHSSLQNVFVPLY
jgi:hypothetical protein